MTLEVKFIQKDGARKVTMGIIVFLMKIFLVMALIPDYVFFAYIYHNFLEVEWF